MWHYSSLVCTLFFIFIIILRFCLFLFLSRIVFRIFPSLRIYIILIALFLFFTQLFYTFQIHSHRLYCWLFFLSYLCLTLSRAWQYHSLLDNHPPSQVIHNKEESWKSTLIPYKFNNNRDYSHFSKFPSFSRFYHLLQSYFEIFYDYFKYFFSNFFLSSKASKLFSIYFKSIKT